jgi:hypothetical protein
MTVRACSVSAPHRHRVSETVCHPSTDQRRTTAMSATWRRVRSTTWVTRLTYRSHCKGRLIQVSRRDPQLSLSLPVRHRWGGSRVGTGRKPGLRPAIRHLPRGRFRRLPAHVTLRMRRDVPSLRTVAVVHEIERTFASGCSRPGFRLVHYSLQGNHAHLIVEASDRESLGRGMMAIASRLARAVNRIAERSGPVLADRYHVRLLPTPKEVRNALRYVLLNARRHATEAQTALDGPARLDAASSAYWFDGWSRREPIDDVARRTTRAPATLARPPVARARTWLLSVGWRRHGLLDPADVPG